jgi:hypothetical protein
VAVLRALQGVDQRLDVEAGALLRTDSRLQIRRVPGTDLLVQGDGRSVGGKLREPGAVNRDGPA